MSAHCLDHLDGGAHGTRWATCACGWVSPIERSTRAAMRALDEHIASEAEDEVLRHRETA